MTEELAVEQQAEGAGDFAMWQKMVGLAFLAQGTAGICQKGLAELQGEYRLFFLCCTYIVATFLSYLLFRARGAVLTKAGVLIGAISGMSCVLSVYFLLAALKAVSGVVVFSIVPATALSLTLLAGRVIFRERLSKSQLAGVLLALAGIVLVQL
ncbi:MAG: EamA family transporter [Armatimonadia bacterium]